MNKDLLQLKSPLIDFFILCIVLAGTLGFPYEMLITNI